MISIHPLDLTKSVLDPLYGLVRLTPEEVKVANHPIFQRLRRIRQNGLLHLVFPAATHTRFEHSLGTLHTADQILQSLIWNSKAIEAKHGFASNDTDDTAIAFHNESTALINDLFKVTRLAALCHDLGHGPLSHTFDPFAPHAELIESFFDTPALESIKHFQKTANKYNRKEGKNAKVAHEVMSVLLFSVIWSEIGSDPDIPAAVAAAILGEDAFAHAPDRFKPWMPLINNIVASAPADADRMDYLQRDSQSTGVSYGLYGRDRLLKSFLCYRSNGRFHLGIKFSGFRAVENFIQARFQLFTQVYYHKTNRAFSAMLDEIAREGQLQNIDLSKSTNLSNLIEDYKRHSDEQFLDALTDRLAGPAKKIAIHVSSRQPWRRVFDTSEHPNKNIEAETIKGALSQKFPNVPFHIDKITPKAGRGLNDGAKPLERNKNGHYICSASSWESLSPLIRTLKKEESITRIYARENDSISAIREQARSLAISL